MKQKTCEIEASSTTFKEKTRQNAEFKTSKMSNQHGKIKFVKLQFDELS